MANYKELRLKMEARIVQLQSDLDVANNLNAYLSSSVETAVGQIEADAITIEGLRSENADLKVKLRPTAKPVAQRTTGEILIAIKTGDNRVKVGDQLYVADSLRPLPSGYAVKSGTAPTFFLNEEGVGHIPAHRVAELLKA